MWTSPSRVSRVSSDGRFALLQSRADLTGYSSGGATQLFRYDAAADGGAGELTCVSCNPSGGPPAGPSTVPTGLTAVPRVMSDDGRYVFFDSLDALVPRDVNGGLDAYVWSDGRVGLLSTGRSTDRSRFFDASADGRQAFFVTRERLVGQDVDSNADLYVASVDGGLASQQATPPVECSGDECQGAGAGAPGARDPVTSRFDGAGNVRQARPRRCVALMRRAKGARHNARRLGRIVRRRRAAGAPARRLVVRHQRAVKRAKRVTRRARRCGRAAR